MQTHVLNIWSVSTPSHPLKALEANPVRTCHCCILHPNLQVQGEAYTLK